MLSQQLIIELQTIIREEYGQELEMKEISMLANNLVDYFNLLAKVQDRIEDKQND